MLDQLNIDNTEHSWGVQDADLQLRKNADVREGNVDTRAGEMHGINVGSTLLKDAPVTGGAVTPDTDPRLLKYGLGVGRVKEDPGTGGEVVEHAPTERSWDADIQPPEALAADPQVELGGDTSFKSTTRAPGMSFVGDAENQQFTRDQALMNEVLKRPEFQDNEIQQAGQAVRGGLSQGIPANAFGDDPTQRIVDPKGNVVKQFGVNRNDPPTMELNYPPVAGITANMGRELGFTEGGTQAVRRRADGSIDVTPVPGGAAVSARNSAANITDGLRNRLTTASGNLAYWREQAGVGMFDRQPNRTPEVVAAEQEYQQALGSVFAESGAAPDLQALAMQIALDPEDSRKPLILMLQDGTINPADFPEQNDLQILQELLNYARGSFQTPGVQGQ